VRAAVFIRYHSGDELGHVGWAFDYDPPSRVNSGSVENHSGHFFSPSQGDDFWTQFSSDPAALMRARKYDDAKWFEVENADPISAYRVVLWVKTQAYRAAHRNCEDDVYDVLRTFGVPDLPVPMFHWFPRRFFALARGTKIAVADIQWQSATVAAHPAPPDPSMLTPLRPTWRTPIHLDFHLFHIGRLLGLLSGLKKNTA